MRGRVSWDSPDGFVGNDEVLPLLGRENGGNGVELSGHDVDGLAGLALLICY